MNDSGDFRQCLLAFRVTAIQLKLIQDPLRATVEALLEKFDSLALELNNDRVTQQLKTHCIALKAELEKALKISSENFLLKNWVYLLIKLFNQLIAVFEKNKRFPIDKEKVILTISFSVKECEVSYAQFCSHLVHSNESKKEARKEITCGEIEEVYGIDQVHQDIILQKVRDYILNVNRPSFDELINQIDQALINQFGILWVGDGLTQLDRVSFKPFEFRKSLLTRWVYANTLLGFSHLSRKDDVLFRQEEPKEYFSFSVIESEIAGRHRDFRIYQRLQVMGKGLRDRYLLIYSDDAFKEWQSAWGRLDERLQELYSDPKEDALNQFRKEFNAFIHGLSQDRIKKRKALLTLAPQDALEAKEFNVLIKHLVDRHIDQGDDVEKKSDPSKFKLKKKDFVLTNQDNLDLMPDFYVLEKEEKRIVLFEMVKDAGSEQNHPDLSFLGDLIARFRAKVMSDFTATLYVPLFQCRGHFKVPTEMFLVGGLMQKNHVVLLEVEISPKGLVFKVHDPASSTLGYPDKLVELAKSLSNGVPYSYQPEKDYRSYQIQNDAFSSAYYVHMYLVSILILGNSSGLNAIRLTNGDVPNKKAYQERWQPAPLQVQSHASL